MEPSQPAPTTQPPGHLERLALELVNDPADLAQQEGPGVDEVDAVHHDGNDAVPALEAPGQAVLDEERVAEHEAMLLVPKEDGALAAGADLGHKDSAPGHHPLYTGDSCSDSSSCTNEPTLITRRVGKEDERGSVRFYLSCDQTPQREHSSLWNARASGFLNFFLP